ncbi:MULTISPECIES: hypothetical protein [unclassified Nocardia]|uniref:hypothetical protein n=1 Tax=unclassified Nocardia TaxID=2637762 RepID=UPI001CE49076|nr:MULTISPECIES: hypothetical protein [unclassified Nocardia]
MKILRSAATRLLPLALLTLGSAALVPAHTAYAAGPGPLTCNGTENVTFDPAVTSTTHDVKITIDDRYGPCPITPDPQLTGGTTHLEITRPLSCTSAVLVPAGTETDKWNNGAQSSVGFTKSVVTVLANGSHVDVHTGTVTSGLDAGFTATKTVTDPDFSLACNTVGMTTLSGEVTIEFT